MNKIVSLTEAKIGDRIMVKHDLRDNKLKRRQQIPIQNEQIIEVINRSDVGFLTGVQINKETFVLSKEETDHLYGVLLHPM